ncbi:GNAT family N-acetyltransferase [Streptomyces sp. NRRL F-4428]|uniref:GNAT family N-acetyltransferase n=1 Tax=Streptomyces sp. NRRL F-4428 TaxID=1609137 RepID=UPI0005EC8AC1|nr:GNAT family N-acetyltransferase [Streptomyces sp. NRRL F-4428]KJK42156.1 acetyltransferase [Streptomyces sp. NRRL F-4428]
MKINVRPAVGSDLSSLLGLYGELNPDDAPLPQERADAIWAAISNQQGRTVLVADTDGAVAGTADCLVLPNLTRGGRAVLFVENVVVAEAFQRRGVGRHLMDAVVQVGEAAGCYKVQLLAADDEYVHRFYESCGFLARAEGFRRYIERPDSTA